MGKVATKRVKLVCGEKSAEVDALVTTAGEVSAMSDHLATQLNLTPVQPIQVDNFGMKATGYLPNSAARVIVQCKVNSEDSHITIPIAILIIPNYHHELVLGTDWLSKVCVTSGARVMYNYSNTEDLNITREGTWISIGSGYPTPGPSFVPNVESVCHLLEISEDDRAKLAVLENAV